MAKENNSNKTTIELKKETKNKLDTLKIIPRETYDSVINRILTNASTKN